MCMKKKYSRGYNVLSRSHYALRKGVGVPWARQDQVNVYSWLENFKSIPSYYIKFDFLLRFWEFIVCFLAYSSAATVSIYLAREVRRLAHKRDEQQYTGAVIMVVWVGAETESRCWIGKTAYQAKAVIIAHAQYSSVPTKATIARPAPQNSSYQRHFWQWRLPIIHCLQFLIMRFVRVLLVLYSCWKATYTNEGE